MFGHPIRGLCRRRVLFCWFWGFALQVNERRNNTLRRSQSLECGQEEGAGIGPLLAGGLGTRGAWWTVKRLWPPDKRTLNWRKPTVDLHRSKDLQGAT